MIIILYNFKFLRFKILYLEGFKLLSQFWKKKKELKSGQKAVKLQPYPYFPCYLPWDIGDSQSTFQAGISF